VVLASAGCGTGPEPAPALPPVTTTASPQATASPAATTPAATTTRPPPASCAERTLAGLDPAHRAAQLLMVGVPADDPTAGRALVTAAAVGGVFLRGRSARPVTEIGSDVAALQAAAAAAGTLPLEVSADQEGGQVQTLSGPGMPTIPSALQQGRLDPASLAGRTTAWSTALRQAGVTLDLAPVADVVPAGTGAANPPIGAVDRQYGSTPDVVSSAVSTVVTASRAAGVGTTLKHFPGLGRVTVNTDTGRGAVDPATTVDDAALAPFAAGIAAGTTAVMMSSASYPALDPRNLAVFSRAVVTDLLRARMGFGGLVVTDDVGQAVAVQAVPVGDRAVRFVAAGGDVVLTVRSSDAAPMTAALVATAAADPVFAAQVDAAVTRVLQAKVDAGLLRCG
jgi:beta-N-acetylhexosaminidase